MQKFLSVVGAFLVALTLAFIGLFVVSQYVNNTNDCTVTALVEIQTSSARRKAYRVYTADCGTFSVSAVPIRGIDTADAFNIYSNLNIGERYTFTYLREGFGVFSVNPSLIDVESVK